MCQRVGRVELSELTDHIVPVKNAEDPRFWDHSNHQGLSAECHRLKTQDDIRLGLTRGPVLPSVVVVSGLPGTGKTAYVRERLQRGDLVVDVDALYSALSGLEWYDKPANLLPFVTAARDAVYARLQRPVTAAMKAWLITSDTREAKVLALRFRGEVIELTLPEEERLKRIAGDTRRRGTTTK